MQRLWLVSAVVVLAASTAAAARLRAPSCEALVAFALGARVDPVEISFGQPISAMTVSDFDQAIDVVTACTEEIADGPADVQGLLPRERKRTQLNALTMLGEDLGFYRSRQREREQRAARRD